MNRMSLWIKFTGRDAFYMSKLENKLDNFASALKRLNEAVAESRQADASDVVRDGMIQRFEFINAENKARSAYRRR